MKVAEKAGVQLQDFPSGCHFGMFCANEEPLPFLRLHHLSCLQHVLTPSTGHRSHCASLSLCHGYDRRNDPITCLGRPPLMRPRPFRRGLWPPPRDASCSGHTWAPQSNCVPPCWKPSLHLEEAGPQLPDERGQSLRVCSPRWEEALLGMPQENLCLIGQNLLMCLFPYPPCTVMWLPWLS